MNMILYMYLIISFIISSIMLLLSIIFSFKSPNKEKVTMYECGFNAFHSMGEPFSIKFFLVAILFLIFDLEVLYLFPWVTNSNLLNYFSQTMMFLFLILLMLGLLYEWMKGGLEWS